ALRHCPARERAVPLEAEVVVEPARVVALDDEDRLLASFLGLAEGLRSLLRVALAPVFLQFFSRHGLGSLHGSFVGRERAAYHLLVGLVGANTLSASFSACGQSGDNSVDSVDLRGFHNFKRPKRPEAVAPSAPPSPMLQEPIGERSRVITACERAIMPPCPCCSAATPG